MFQHITNKSNFWTDFIYALVTIPWWEDVSCQQAYNGPTCRGHASGLHEVLRLYTTLWNHSAQCSCTYLHYGHDVGYGIVTKTETTRSKSKSELDETHARVEWALFIFLLFKAFKPTAQVAP